MQTTPKASESPTRTVVRLMTAEGKSVREIASVLGISTQAVHKHLKKMRGDERKSA